MKKLLVLCALCCAIICPAQAAEASFSDVAPDAWYAPYVEVCTEAGIMRGVGEGRFEPERSLTMAEAIVLGAQLQAKREGLETVPHYKLPPDLQLFLDEEGNQTGNLSDIKWLVTSADKNGDIYRALMDLQGSASGWYTDHLIYLASTGAVSLERVGYNYALEGPDFIRLERRPCFRGNFGNLVMRAIPSLIATQIPEDIMEVDDLGSRVLILTGIMERTEEGYALDQELTRAEAAAMTVKIPRPELRMTPTAEARQTEELTKIKVQHRSFGRVEYDYTLDLEENTLTAFTSGHLEGPDVPDKEEILPLEEAAVERFLCGPPAARLLEWREVYLHLNYLDGHQWEITLTFQDGETRQILGSNAYPEGWDSLYDALYTLTGKNILDVRSDWIGRQ